MKAGSKIAIGAGGIGFIALVAFLLLVGYYVWQFQFGNAETQNELHQTFGTNFSLDSEKDNGHGLGSLSTIDNPSSLIHTHNPTFGDPDAPITIIAFIDFECPYCRNAFTTFEQMKETYSPVIRVVFKHFPLESIHPNARAAAIAAQCANEQGTFWDYYKALFIGSALDQTSLNTYAANTGLNLQAFIACQKDIRTNNIVTADLSDGARIGVRGTPTYIINGVKYEGVIEPATWDQILLSNLQ